ncbi:unnamed protein product [Allacma fusca]|uniref:Uncharacterized protein n=1 Tax=Allacma fusca TaxID=39272 RepID=A0A8J2KAB8_9HEXA|nr:unnamed protein product [Allacma fusca]
MFTTMETGNGDCNIGNQLESRRNSARPRRKRKFPGPAGILPDLNDSDVTNLNKMQNQVSQQVAQIISGSQRARSRSPSPFSMMSSQAEKNMTFLAQGPWQELTQQLNLSGDENCPSKLMNINWVHSYAAHLPAGAKVPFLLGVLQEAPELPSGKHQKKTPCVKLGDSSGTIEAAFDPVFVKLYGKDLKPGTALAVTNAGLLHFKRNIILTITAKNVICLASATESNELCVEDVQDTLKSNPVPSVVTEHGVKIIFITDFSAEKVVKNYRELCDPNAIRKQYIQNQKNKQTSYQSLVGKPAAPKLFTHITNAAADSNSCRELFVNFDEEDDDDELFRAFDIESAENLYLSQQLDQSKKLPVKVQTFDVLQNQINQEDDRESEDEFDRELAAFDDSSCAVFESSQSTKELHTNNENSELNSSPANDDSSDNADECDIFESSQATQSQHLQNNENIVERSSSPESNHSAELNPQEDNVEHGLSNAADEDDSDFFNEFDRELDEL